MHRKIVSCHEFDDVIQSIKDEEKRSEKEQEHIWRILLNRNIIEIKDQ